MVKGIVYTTTKVKDTKTYTIANRNDTDRGHGGAPHRTDFKLTSKDKPWETASDVHRFKVSAPAGKTTTYIVSEERLGSSVAITNNDDQSIRILINQPVTSAAVKKRAGGGHEPAGRGTAATQREIQKVEQDLRVITTDQERLRKNLREMPQEAGVQALSEEVRRSGDADRGPAQEAQGPSGRGARPAARASRPSSPTFPSSNRSEF